MRNLNSDRPADRTKEELEPLEDLQAEWLQEDIEIDRRKPNLEEYEEDLSAR